MVEEFGHDIQSKDTVDHLGVTRKLVDPVQQSRVELVRKQREKFHHNLGEGKRKIGGEEMKVSYHKWMLLHEGEVRVYTCIKVNVGWRLREDEGGRKGW